MYQFPRSQQVRMLADCDSFFASCEIARNPKFENKAVCVGKKGNIVLAANYIAKRQGVSTGTPMREAKKQLGNSAVFCKPDLKLYSYMSKKVFAIIDQYTKTMIQFSIDEAFGDITNSQLSYHAPSYKIYAQHIQQQIIKHTRIPISLGIAPTKLLAKIFAGLHKPRGICCQLTQLAITKRIQHLPITTIPFLGKKQARKLPRCETIGDFMQTRQKTVQKIMGKHGCKLWRELHKVNTLQFNHNKPPKSISRRKSFNPYFINNKEELWAKLMHNISIAYEYLSEQECKCKLIKVSLKSKEFQKYEKKIRLPKSTNEKKTITQTAKKIFDNIYQNNLRYRTTTIVLGELEHQRYDQKTLFGQQGNCTKQREIAKKIETINQKYGKRLVYSASENVVNKVQKEITHYETS